GGGLLSRSGADTRKAPCVRAGGQRDARTADHPHVGRSRDGVRHRRQGRRGPCEYDRSGEAGRSPRATVMKERTERELAQTNIAENRRPITTITSSKRSRQA